MNPDGYYPRKNLALVELDSGNPAEAARRLEECRRLWPQDPEIVMTLAGIRFQGFEDDRTALPSGTCAVDLQYASLSPPCEVSEVVFADEGSKGFGEPVLVMRPGQAVLVPPLPRMPRIEGRWHLRDGPSPDPTGLSIESTDRRDGLERGVEGNDVAERTHATVRPARTLEPRGPDVAHGIGTRQGFDDLALDGS